MSVGECLGIVCCLLLLLLIYILLAWFFQSLTVQLYSNALSTLQDHPNIVRLEEVYESHSEIYLVQEVCKGGELFDRLDEQPDYHYTEAQCARLVKQMLSSVTYIHNKGIIHR